MNIFLDVFAAKHAMIQAGSAIFNYVYRESGPPLGNITYGIFSRRAAAMIIKQETLPPERHALNAYLQKRDWLLLKNHVSGSLCPWFETAKMNANEAH